MGAPKFNQFWKLRSKHGRDKEFTPDSLKEACSEYFETTSKMSIDEKDWVGKEAREVTKEHPVPFTLSGLCLFLGITFQTWENYKKGEAYKDFFEVVTHTEQIIYTQKFSYAAVNFFNANIIARDLGLSDKKDLTSGDGTMSPKITLVHNDNEISLKEE